ncbi:MAG: hypothetical protein AB1414_04915 [bacterium]
MQVNKLSFIIGGVLLSLVLFSQNVLAKKIDLSGNTAISVTQTNINNKTIEDIPPDLTVGVEYLVNGRFLNLDLNSAIELKFNNRDDDWDEIVKSFTFGLSRTGMIFELGDVYEEISDFTLSDDVSPKFGLKFNRRINLGEKSEFMLIGGRLQEASVYEIDEDEDGVLDANEDKNGNERWDYGYTYYDQWLGGMRFSSSPTKNTFLGITYLKINDDKDSREERGTATTPPIKNDVVAIDSAVSFFNHFLTLSGELARNSYEEVGSPTAHDKAYKVSLKADKKKWNFEMGYDYIGTDYFSAGSPYLEKTDTKGYFTTAEWLPNEIYSFILEGEIYEDNLENDSVYPITKTKVISTIFELKPEKYPQITLECKLTDELSDRYTDSYPKLDKLTKEISLELSHSIEETDLVLDLQRSDIDDKSSDSYGTEYEDYKSDVLSLTLDTKFAQKFTLANYLSYTKNKTGNEKDDTLNTTIDLIYDIIPQKLILKPGYEFEEYRIEKNCSSKEWTAKLAVDYYRSFTSQFTFSYEWMKNKDKENPATDYKADRGMIKYTKMF